MLDSDSKNRGREGQEEWPDRWKCAHTDLISSTQGIWLCPEETESDTEQRRWRMASGLRKSESNRGELFTQETKTTQCWPEGLKLLPLQLGYTLESLECRREHMGSFESVLRTLNAQPHWTTHSSYRARVIPDGRGGVPEKSAIQGKLDKRIGREGEDNRGCRGLKGKYIWSLGEALNTKLSCAWFAGRSGPAGPCLYLPTTPCFSS